MAPPGRKEEAMNRLLRLSLLCSIHVILAILSGMSLSAFARAATTQSLNHAEKMSLYEGAATCLKCHAVSASSTDLLADIFTSAHFQVRTPNPLIGMPGGGSHGMIDRACGLPGTTLMAGNFAGTATSQNGTEVSEGCGKCHIAYRPPYRYASPADARDDIDCLICHAAYYGEDWADPAVTTLFGTNPDARPRTVVTLPDGTRAWSQDRTLKTAQSVGLPTTAHACLRCHEHNMGGYKRATPYEAANDVHAARGRACAKCHTTTRHRMARGDYVTDMVASEQSTQPTTCIRCHGVAPHTAANGPDLNRHTANVSCEVCHIPAMASEENIAARSWAPFTLDPRTGAWSDTRAVLADGLYAPHTSYHEAGAAPLVRWFDGGASMLAQPSGSFATRASSGGSSRLFAFKPFVNGMLFDAGWLPGPSSDPLFDMTNGTWPYSMKAYYENNWPKFLAMGFVDPQYPTARDFWRVRPDMAAMLNNFPMMLFLHRPTFLAEAGTIIGTPPPGPQNAASFPGLAKAINRGMGTIGIEMGYFPPDSDPAAVGKNLWSGSFFGMWAPVDMDPTSPFRGELASFITLSHGIKGPAVLGTGTTSCGSCHYTSTEYQARKALPKRLDFGLLGWPNLDANPIIDPMYDRSVPASTPAVDRISFKYVLGKSAQTLRISTTVVDSSTRAPLTGVKITGTLTGPAGQTGLPFTASADTDSYGNALVTFTQKKLLNGTYTWTVRSLTSNGVTNPANVSSQYTKQ